MQQRREHFGVPNKKWKIQLIQTLKQICIQVSIHLPEVLKTIIAPIEIQNLSEIIR